MKEMETLYFLGDDGLRYLKSKLDYKFDEKVDKEEGKGLSENDYTDEDKAVVDGIEAALDEKVDKAGDTMTGGLTVPNLTVGSRDPGSVGINSASEGQWNIASGDNSHAEGESSQATGYASHAEGNATVSYGAYSHSEGSVTRSNGYASHAEGQNTIAGYDYQHVAGKYNDNKQANAFEIGNGHYNRLTEFEPTYSNALELTWEGDLSISGEFTDGNGKSTSTNDYTDADKAIVDGIDAALDLKVDKVEGKGLSTNDYTNVDKDIVDGVGAALDGKVDKVSGKGLSTNDYTNADKAIVDGIDAELAKKQDIIQVSSMPSPTEDYEGKILQYVGTPTGSYMNGHFYICVESTYALGEFLWKETGAQVLTLPHASRDYEGQIFQYVGPNASGRQNGQFYMCVYNEMSGTYSWQLYSNFIRTSSSPGIITHDGQYDKKPYVYEITADDGPYDGVVAFWVSADPHDGTLVEQQVALQVAGWNNKVDKVTGKGLSENDYTDADQQKLTGMTNIRSIGSGLNFNTSTGELSATGVSIPIDTEMSTTSVNPVQNKVITEALDDKVDKVSGKGLSTNDYDDTAKGIVDGVTAALADKVDKVSGKGLSTNDYDNTAKGIVDGITAALADKVDKHGTDSLMTAEEHTKLSGIAAGAEVNVQPDWNQNNSDADDYIKNKPIAVTSVSQSVGEGWDDGYTKLDYQVEYSNGYTYNGSLDLAVKGWNNKADKKPHAINGNFASFDSNGNIQDSGHKHSDYLTSHQDISGKADKVSGATYGNFAALDSLGNLMDSGSKASDFLTNQSLYTCYQTGDTAETNLDDADYVPFYDSSATAKRKSLWSNIKSVLKTYFDTLYLNDIEMNRDTATAYHARWQQVKKNGTGYTISGTLHMETSTKTTSSGTDTFTFTSGHIQTTSAIDVYADVFGVVPTAVTVSSGSCAVSFSSSDNVTTCRIYIK